MFSFIVERAIKDAHKISAVQPHAISVKTLNFNITEPESVANLVLYEMSHLFDHGDIFLILDVGGATADPFIAQAAVVHGHYICSPQKLGVSLPGVSRGVLDIDQKFQFDAFNRLTAAGVPDPLGLSYKIRESEPFKDQKKLLCWVDES